MGGFNKILNYVRYEILKGKAFQKCRINVNGLRWGKKTKTKKKNPKLKGCRKNKKTSASTARAK